MKFRPLLVAGVLGAASLVATAPPAEATLLTKLPVDYVSDIEVDDADGTVFLSGDGSLVTTDLAGKLTSFPDPGDVGRIARTPDGSSLVITRPAGKAISVIDPATGVVTKTIGLPAGCSVGDIAPASGKVFFYSFCTGDDAWKISAVDLSTNLFTFGLQTPEQGYNGTLYSVPAAPSMLVTWIDNRVIVYDTTGGLTPTATVRASRVLSPHDMALTPDGSKVLIPGVSAYSTTDLAQVGGYYAPNSGPLAVRGDGMVATVGYADLRYFDPGVFEPAQVRPLSASGEYSAPGSLVFGAKRLYRVSGTVPAYLSVDTPGPPAAVQIAPVAATYGYGAAPSVRVTIVSPTTSRVVKVYAATYGVGKKLVKTVDVGPTGSATASMPAATLTTTYTAEFEGDADYSAGVATATAGIRPKITLSTASTSTSGIYHKLAGSRAQSLYVKILPSKPVSGCLDVYFQRLTSSGWVSNGTAKCVSRGANVYKAGVSGTRGQKIRVRASLHGSVCNANATTSWYYIVYT